MKKINRLALRGVMGVGKVALFCVGLLAMLALIVVATVFTAVMLVATILPATAGGRSARLGNDDTARTPRNYKGRARRYLRMRGGDGEDQERQGVELIRTSENAPSTHSGE